MIETLELTPPVLEFSDGQRLTLNLFQEIQIYEALDQFWMSGFITFLDAGVLSRKVVGGEKITFNFRSLFHDGVINQTFKIYGKTTENIDERGVRALKLLFISEEALLLSSQNIVDGWSDSIPNIIGSILDTLPLSTQPGGTKQFLKDSSPLSFPYLAPNISGSEVLYHLVPLCVDNSGHPFIFFENCQAINFKSIHTLLQNYDDSITFTYDSLLSSSSLASLSVETRASKIQNVAVVNNIDFRTLVGRGSLASSVSGFDFLAKQPITASYDIKSRTPFSGDKSYPLFENKITDPHIGTNKGDVVFIPEGGGGFMTSYAQHVNFSQAVNNLTNAVKVEFSQTDAVYFHRVGDCVDIAFDNQILTDDGMTVKKNEPGRKLNGRFLISNVVHRFSIMGRPTYNTDVGAIKLGYGEAV